MDTPYLSRKIHKRLEWLKSWFYRPLAHVDLSIAEFDQYQSIEQIEGISYTSILPNQRWGKEWGSAWFKGQFKVDAEIINAQARGQRFLLQIETGGESLVYLDRKPIGAIDREHKEIILSPSELTEGKHQILIQSYAGHNIFSYDPRPVELIDYNWTPPIYKYCNLVKRNEAAWQLYHDMAVLYYTGLELDQDSLRRIKIFKSLAKAINTITWETTDINQRNLEFVAAREDLAPLLKQKNGPTTPGISLIGHSHIDIAWLWPIEETIRKIGRTFSTQLQLMEEYPNYKFIQSQAQAYAYAEKHYPEIFKKIKRAVQDKQWEVNGGMWVEADTNLPSAESLIRQFLVGQSYFFEKFGIDTNVLWLPDAFGYSGNLPQIMKGCGIKYFVTSKIGWNDTNEFPVDLFRWRGIDGSEIMTIFIKNTYNSDTKPKNLWQNWREFICKEHTDQVLDSVGYGDGGGGITMGQLEYASRARDLEGLPRAEFRFVSDFMEEISKDSHQFPVYSGELYMENHRGTYTSQAWTKRNNRKIEFLIRNVEYLTALAKVELENYPFPAKKLKRIWQDILTIQFHDILPGSSINRVYQDCDHTYRNLAGQLDDLLQVTFKKIFANANKTIRGKGEKDLLNILVFNSLNWNYKQPVSIYFNKSNRNEFKISSYQLSQPTLDGDKEFVVRNEKGERLPTQKLEDRLVFLPKGLLQSSFSKYKIEQVSKADKKDLEKEILSSQVVGFWSESDLILENEFLRVKINSQGQVTNIFDKKANRQVLTDKPANVLILAEDLPNNYDAWNIEAGYQDRVNMGPSPENIEVTLIASGPLQAGVRVKTTLGSSSHFVQDILLTRASRKIDFHTEINWQEKHRILKVSFPVNVFSSQANFNIPGGYLGRPTHKNTSWEKAKFEVPAQKWVDLSEVDYGVALLNDCKYGYEVSDNNLVLTLLKSATTPDPTADQGRQVFTYSLYPHPGDLVSARVPQIAYELNALPEIFCVDEEIAESKGQPLISINSDRVWLQSTKLAEDGVGVIFRMAELNGQRQNVDLHFHKKIKAAWETNMLEEKIDKIKCEGLDKISGLKFSPFEIKTIKILFFEGGN